MLRIFFIIFFAMMIANTPTMGQRELWMSSTDQNISKRAQTQPKPIFKVRVGAMHVAQMDLINDELLLVGLVEDDKRFELSKYVLLSTKDGSVIWEYETSDGPYNLIWIDQAQLVFRVRDKKRHYIKVLDLAKGNEIWSTSIDTESRTLIIPETSQIWICDGGIIQGLSLSTGINEWETTLPIDPEHPFFWLKDEEKVFLFSNKTLAYQIGDENRLAWVNDQVKSFNSPYIPTIDNSCLYLTDNNHHLLRIDKNNGRVLQNIDLPYNVTNITIRKGRVYIRCFDDSGYHHFLMALDSSTLDRQWSIHTDEPVISNLIQDEKQVYFATASQIFCADPGTGKIEFNKKVTSTGRNFPVTLMKKQGKIVYIGELVIAAYDTQTGSIAYKYGFTPLDGELHLNGLDASLPMLRDKLAGLQGYELSGASDLASREAQYYQKLADEKYRELETLRQLGQPNTQLNANLARSRARVASSYSRMQSGLALSFAMVELGYALQNMIESNATEYQIRKQEHFRKSIIEVCNRSLTEDYIFRPNYIHYSPDDNYARVSIVNLSTGSISHHYMSPSYLNYGYWNVVDYDNKVIYHHGVGMQPEDYQLSDARPYPVARYKTVETFIIAVPFE